MHILDDALSHAISGDVETSYELLKVVEDLPEAQFNLGWHECRLGNLHKGISMMTAGRYLNCFGSPPVKTDKPIWMPEEDLNGKKVLLSGEGGFGDHIINIRFAKNLKKLGAYVTASCGRSLMPLFRELDYIDALVEHAGEGWADHDYWIPAMSAIVPLGLEYNDLDARPYIPKFYSERCDNFRVGLKLKGNPEFEHEQHRKFPARYMLDLVDDRAEFISLDLEDVPGLKNVEMGDWLETAKLLCTLDLVITSCTGIAHLAAAMGIRTWVVVPILPYYIWALPDNTSPWYNSVKLYRQKEYGNWDAPFINIKKDLEEKLCNYTAK